MTRRRSTLLVLSLFAAVSLLWAQSQQSKQSPPASPPPPSKAALDSGKKLYAEQCAICHFEASTAKKVGPGLKGLAKRGKFADGKPVTDEALRVWIENGGENMPSFKGMLSAEEIRDLVLYTKSL